MELAATVSGLFIYPIKGCRGISVSQACISSTGFRWDRQWMVVNSKLRSCTQRVEPKLALVEVELPAEAFSGGWEPEGDSVMVIRAPGMYALKIPLKKEHLVVDNVSVWEWSGSVLDEGHEASEWFSNYLGNHCRLVRFNSDSEVRAVDPKYSPGYKTMFSDGFPFLLISQGSLDALNERLEGTVPINRFRPNIVVDGCDPFSEDLWTVFKICEIEFHGVKLCSRCKVPTIDQETGEGGVEPTETLLKFRSDIILRPGKNHKGKVYFGQNLICKDSPILGENWPTVKVGDPIHVLQKLSCFADAAV
ncbi:molybdenum cofactor sulfurase family protein [Wolffia australiana]